MGGAFPESPPAHRWSGNVDKSAVGSRLAVQR